MGAVHSDQKQSFAAGSIIRVREILSEEMGILQCQRRQIAGAHTDDGDSFV